MCQAAPPSNRVDCGYPGITQYSCIRRGCCWDTNDSGVPPCFYSSDAAVPALKPECAVNNPKDRIDCGYPGIKERVCRKKGCCWDSSVYNVPWCFYSKDDTPNCDVGNPSNRVDCGYPGIPRDVCLQRNCCWDNSIHGVIWCFHGISSTSDTATTSTATVHPHTTSKASATEPQHTTLPPQTTVTDGATKPLQTTVRSQTTVLPLQTTVFPQTTLTTTVDAHPQIHCNLPPKLRTRCGQHDVSREQCIKLTGCCWHESTLNGVPWCYHGKPGVCGPWLPSRLTCGYVGIDEKRCLETGCCWDTYVRGRSKCFHPIVGQSQVVLHWSIQVILW